MIREPLLHKPVGHVVVLYPGRSKAAHQGPRNTVVSRIQFPQLVQIALVIPRGKIDITGLFEVHRQKKIRTEVFRPYSPRFKKILFRFLEPARGHRVKSIIERLIKIFKVVLYPAVALCPSGHLLIQEKSFKGKKSVLFDRGATGQRPH